MSVTPTIAREFRMAADNKTLQDEIIKRFVASEASWLEDEMKLIDEQVVRYRAKLLGIRDAFTTAQDSYISEIEGISNKATETFRKVDGFTHELNQKIERSASEIRQVATALDNMDVAKLERLMVVIDKFNAMSPEDKAIITLLLNK